MSSGTERINNEVIEQIVDISGEIGTGSQKIGEEKLTFVNPNPSRREIAAATVVLGLSLILSAWALAEWEDLNRQRASRPTPNPSESSEVTIFWIY
ncbi:MAG: hypothetical protein HYW63_02585 [Candidatus Levybacteria bacterium]|nr:hypothetical protein [Candidatus Levybacteria bacterium]